MKKLLLFIPIVLMLNSCGSLLSITIEGPSLYRQDLNQVDADADGWIYMHDDDTFNTFRVTIND